MIGAFVAVTAVATWQMVSSSRVKIERNIEVAGELRYAARLMREDLANVYRDKKVENVVLAGEVIEGKANESSVLLMHTVSRRAIRVGQAEGDVYEVEYFLDDRSGKSCLVRRVWPNPSELGEDEQDESVLTVVGEDIVGFDVMFLDGVSGQWQEQWDRGAKELPEQIKVELVGQGQGQKRSLRNIFVVNWYRWPNPAEKTAKVN